MLKTQVIGNIGGEPELKYAASGSGILRFSVASNGRRKDGDEWVDETTWVRVTVLGRRAESLAEHLKKGTRVFVDGKLEARPWTNQAGAPQAGLEILANDVDFMSSRQEGAGGGIESRGTKGPVTALGERKDEPAELADLPF